MQLRHRMDVENPHGRLWAKQPTKTKQNYAQKLPIWNNEMCKCLSLKWYIIIVQIIDRAPIREANEISQSQ